jgi:DNA repair photolyase
MEIIDRKELNMSKTLFDTTTDRALARSLLKRLDPKYAPAFDRLSEEQQDKAALYFLPHTSEKEILSVTRPRVIKWYCPFADQKVFPSGVRYSINVYSGCEHGCQYCYVRGYSGAKIADGTAKCKDNFRRQLLKDLADIEKYDVPCTPVHLSNSTDAFGAIEGQFQNSLFVLEKLREYRHRFSTVTILTKNPATLLHSSYLNTLLALSHLHHSHPRYKYFQDKNLPPLWLEISLAFWNDQSREMLEPGAPSVARRLDAIDQLQHAGVPVALRIDPLFPRNPLPQDKSMRDFGLFDFQSQDDLQNLVSFCKQYNIKKIVYSPLKITNPRVGKLPALMYQLKRVYENLAQDRPLDFHGGSWRLPHEVAQTALIAPLLRLCQSAGVAAKGCKENLLATP